MSSTSLLKQKQEAFNPQPATRRVFLHEGNLVPRDAPGELKTVMRAVNYSDTDLTTVPPRAYSSVSNDGDHTWSTAVPEPDLHNAKSKGFFGQSINGTYQYV